jgi:hypothetical protein
LKGAHQFLLRIGDLVAAKSGKIWWIKHYTITKELYGLSQTTQMTTAFSRGQSSQYEVNEDKSHK